MRLLGKYAVFLIAFALLGGGEVRAYGSEPQSEISVSQRHDEQEGTNLDAGLHKISILYENDKALPRWDYAENGKAFIAIANMVQQLSTKEGSHTIVIEGGASPVGRESYNQKLSMSRAIAMRDAIARMVGGDRLNIKVKALGEDWTNFLSYVESNYRDDNRDDVLAILRSNFSHDEKEYRVKLLDKGKTWRALVDEYMNSSRNVTVAYTIRVATVEESRLNATKAPIAPVAPKVETPVVAAPVVAEQKAEQPKVETPAEVVTEQPKGVVAEPKTESVAPIVAEPKAEEVTPKVETPTVVTEQPKEVVAEPKTESVAPIVAEPKAEEVAPKVETPAVAVPVVVEHKAEQPKAEQPKAEQPKAEQPKAEQPKAEKQPKSEKPKAEKQAEPEQPMEPRKPVVAVRTNLLVLALNVGVEVPIGTHWSVGADYYFPWVWPKRDNKNCFELLSWGIEGRYWFGRNRTVFDRLQGHSVGVYGYMGYYDFERNYHGHQGEFVNVGLDYTYAMAVGKRKSVHFEFSLGVGFIYSQARRYTVIPDHGVLISDKYTKHVRYFGPTKANVSLVVPIFKKVKPNDKTRHGDE